jgi:hypothetical protein
MVIARAVHANCEYQLIDQAFLDNSSPNPEYGPHFDRFHVIKNGEMIASNKGWKEAHDSFLSNISDAKIDYSDRIILTYDDLRSCLDEITFQNSELDFRWKFEFENAAISDQPCWAVHALFERPDADSGKMGWGRGRDLIVKPGASESAVFFTCYLLIKILIDHELMEGINYRGRSVLYPHTQVTSMIGLQDIVRKQGRTRLN